MTGSIQAIKAMAHPTRIAILEHLRSNELASPTEVSKVLNLSVGTVSYHFRQLEAFGFLEPVKRTERRGAFETHFRLASSTEIEEAVRRIGRGLLTPSRVARSASEAMLDAAAIAELRGEMAKVFERMRQLEADTVTREGGAPGERGRFAVDVVCLVEPVKSTRGDSR